MIERMVKNVLDVPGVEGLCVFDQQGNHRTDWLPPYYVSDEFGELIERAVSLYDTVDEAFLPCDDYLMKFGEKWIHLRRGKGCFLLILSESGVNLTTLRMVTNLLLKNLTPDLLLPEGADPQSQVRTAGTQTPQSPPPKPDAAGPRSTATGPRSAPPDRNRKVTRPPGQRTFRGGSY
ncbi:MAG: hypothetical protein ACFB21_03105 [Opitutales bacterium]